MYWQGGANPEVKVREFPEAVGQRKEDSPVLTAFTVLHGIMVCCFSKLGMTKS